MVNLQRRNRKRRTPRRHPAGGGLRRGRGRVDLRPRGRRLRAALSGARASVPHRPQSGYADARG